jgi:hypothetical protein
VNEVVIPWNAKSRVRVLLGVRLGPRLLGYKGLCGPMVEAFAELRFRGAIERYVFNKSPLEAGGNFGRVGFLYTVLGAFVDDLLEAIPALVVLVRAAIDNKPPFVVFQFFEGIQDNALRRR